MFSFSPDVACKVKGERRKRRKKNRGKMEKIGQVPDLFPALMKRKIMEQKGENRTFSIFPTHMERRKNR